PAEYQTVYAAVPGSAAAPTAGLHFTPTLLEALRFAGVEVERVTLHVGVDTFRPVTEEVVERHAIHSEAYHVEEEALTRLDAARAEGRRLVAVGTTSVRVLETLYRGVSRRSPASALSSGDTSLFITPGFNFRAVDALLTNFHLPRTSLLALVMAFGGVEFVRDIYRHAVSERYRFFSFGDAMFLIGASEGRP
ncbi:MAG: S-adenosylmethionine:tRNA ribosyltransferase-isomerase, partial [Thermoleophilia bacterium]